MARSHKGQHWIPVSYLKAWADPDVPDGRAPYVHIFLKDGSDSKRRAPSNIFKEADFYTIFDPIDGNRDIRLEHKLSRFESVFIRRRDSDLSRRKCIADHALVDVLIFVAGMHVRTRMMHDHHSHFWHEVLDRVEAMRRKDVLVPDATSWSHRRKGMTRGDVQQLADQTLQHMLLPFIRAEAKHLSRMHLLVLCTKDDPGFITSDAPVVWCDPDRKGSLRRSLSFKDPGLEISFPVSPSQALLFTHRPVDVRYLDVHDEFVAEVNARTRSHCDKCFVVRRNHLKHSWFD